MAEKQRRSDTEFKRDADDRDWTHGFDPDDPITLKEAAAIFLRGLVTASTLSAAISGAERIGRRVLTTPAMIREWRRRNGSTIR